METFFIGFLSGVVSIIAIGIFIWTIRRGKTDTSRTLENDIDRNNTDIRRGAERLRENNTETARLNRRAEDNNREAENTASEGLEGIDIARRTVSDIIAAANRKRETDG